jgi:hypothetical protein
VKISALALLGDNVPVKVLTPCEKLGGRATTVLEEPFEGLVGLLCILLVAGQFRQGVQCLVEI